jgi:hypothetical protein
VEVPHHLDPKSELSLPPLRLFSSLPSLPGAPGAVPSPSLGQYLAFVDPGFALGTLFLPFFVVLVSLLFGCHRKNHSSLKWCCRVIFPHFSVHAEFGVTSGSLW